MLSKCYVFEQANERQIVDKKYKWIIDMNEERQLYLNMYFNIECINHLIQN